MNSKHATRVQNVTIVLGLLGGLLSLTACTVQLIDHLQEHNIAMKNQNSVGTDK